MQLKLDSEAVAALRASAAAFERAKRKGYVWIGQTGLFETSEPIDPRQPNPDQLRLV